MPSWARGAQTNERAHFSTTRSERPYEKKFTPHFDETFLSGGLPSLNSSATAPLPYGQSSGN
jgi:hypothetical protein